MHDSFSGPGTVFPEQKSGFFFIGRLWVDFFQVNQEIGKQIIPEAAESIFSWAVERDGWRLWP